MWSDGILNGFVLCVSGPSGSGKTSLCDKVAVELDFAVRSISVTTRPKRAGETSGKDYLFVSREEFEDLEKSDELLESAEVFGNLYGTPKKPVEEAIKKGQMIVMDIDTEGAWNVKKAFGDRCLRIFIMPPSLEELQKRLVGRKQNTPEDLERRLKEAQKEIELAKHYEYIIENRDFDTAYAELLRAVAEWRSKSFPETDQKS